MKKQILKAFLVLAIVGAATSAMAVTSIVSAITIGAGNTFSPSAKVGLSITAGPSSYTAGSCHLNGTKEFGTVGGSGITGTYNDPSKIYFRDIPTQASTNTTGIPTSQTSPTELTGTSGWQ